MTELSQSSAAGQIWVVLDSATGKADTSSLALLSEARRLAAYRQLDVQAVSFSKEQGELRQQLQAVGINKLLMLPQSNSDVTSAAALLAPVVAERAPKLLLFAATVTGREIAARVSGRTDAPLVTCATWFQWREDKMVVTQSLFQGRASQRVYSENSATTIATVQDKIYLPIQAANNAEVVVEILTAETVEEQRIKVLCEAINIAAELALDEVDVIVAGGMGVGSAEGFDQLHKLATALNGRVGASRRVTDQGWVAIDNLVGQTGTVVSPTLYIACGISGAPQHLIGMCDSETIIAINTDRNAPISQVADLMLVGDLHEIIPRMIEVIEARKRKTTQLQIAQKEACG